jgi:hypothetical protein
MRSGYITHKGKQIYLANYAHLTSDEFEQEIKDVTDDLCRAPEHSVACLNDTTGLIASPRIISLFKWSVGKTKPHLSKAAVVGVGFSGARKVLLDTVLKVTGQSATIFDDLDKAKDWLVRE